VIARKFDLFRKIWKECGHAGPMPRVFLMRQVHVAETDAKARRESEDGLLRHLAHFSSGHTSGYLGTVSENAGTTGRDYDALSRDIILHGSPATVVEKIEQLAAMTGVSSIMLHYPPWYGAEKALASLELFAGEVMPKFAAAQRVGAVSFGA